MYYSGTVERLLTGSFTSWFRGCTKRDHRALGRVVHTAPHITGCELPSLEDLCTQHCITRSLWIIGDPTHPHRSMFSPSEPQRGKGYKTKKAQTNRMRNNFFPKATRLLNGRKD